MRWFIDTEFHEDGRIIDLISIGMVREDGEKSFYAISSEFDPNICNDFVKRNVLTRLREGEPRSTRAEIRKAIEALMGEDGERPEFWGYYADFDWVVFCQLWGPMVALPQEFPMYCHDLRQEMLRLGIEKRDLPLQDKATEHDALEDARWVQQTWHTVKEFEQIIKNGDRK